MADTIQRYLLNKEVVVCAADTKELVNVARELHGTYPVCTAALGRTLTGAAMMASTAKEAAALTTLSLNGGGSAGTVLATANGACEVKGYIENPYVNLPARADGKLDVGGAVGKDGFITVLREAARGRNRMWGARSSYPARWPRTSPCTTCNPSSIPPSYT